MNTNWMKWIGLITVTVLWVGAGTLIRSADAVQAIGDADGALAPAQSVVPDWSATGEGGAFGSAVASAGDVNGDGYDDLVVGAKWLSKAYVYYGSASSLSLSPAWSVAASGAFGSAVASAGDVNGDGYADLAVGAPDFGSYEGMVFVYLGSASGLSLSPDWTAVGEADFAFFGWSVAPAGDVNGDGYADLAVGDPFLNGNTGKVYVYFGSASGLSLSPAWSVTGEAGYDFFGLSLASAGDVNGDGYADVVAGAPYFGPISGKVYVYHGSVNGLSATADWSAAPETSGAFGASVASAGDVNGDGYADLVVGAPNYGQRKAYVYLGAANGLNTTPDWIGASEISNSFGLSVASSGDVNGDGYADLVVGAPEYNGLYIGQALMYHGSAGGLSAADWITFGENTYDYYGASVASAGDVNGDGFDDIVIGAWGFNGDMGKAYVYYGVANCTDDCLRVTGIRLWIDSGDVYARVKIKDENGVAVPGAAVSVHWDLPGGSTLESTKNTDAAGSVTFRMWGEAGTYVLTIRNAGRTGYTFDPVASLELVKSISK